MFCMLAFDVDGIVKLPFVLVNFSAVYQSPYKMFALCVVMNKKIQAGPNQIS